MNADELASIRDTLFTAMDEQYNAGRAALEENQKLGQQQIMYNNDARGTLYSGQPTWERAQLVAEGAQNLADLNSDYMSNKLSVWSNITDVVDQIESYNKAAAALTASSSSSSNTSSGQTLLELYQQLLNSSEDS